MIHEMKLNVDGRDSDVLIDGKEFNIWSSSSLEICRAMSKYGCEIIMFSGDYKPYWFLLELVDFVSDNAYYACCQSKSQLVFCANGLASIFKNIPKEIYWKPVPENMKKYIYEYYYSDLAWSRDAFIHSFRVRCCL